MPALAIRKGTRLLPIVAGKPDLTRFLFIRLGVAYRIMGEMEASDNYFLKTLEISEWIGDPTQVLKVRLHLITNMFMRGDYEGCHTELMKYKEAARLSEIRYILAMHAVAVGNLKKCLRIVEALLGTIPKYEFWFGVLEIKGEAMRFMGRLDESVRIFLDTIRGFRHLTRLTRPLLCLRF